MMIKFKFLIIFIKKLKLLVNMVELNSFVGFLYVGFVIVFLKFLIMFSEWKISFNKVDNRWFVVKKKRDKNCKCLCFEMFFF